MPYYANGNLLTWWRSRSVQYRTIQAAADIVLRLVNALSFAHSQGVIHRDVKPDNILIDASESPIICDWGIGKFLQRRSGSVTGGGGLGTPGYCAPEQWNGWTVDQRADVFSLGVLFVELITGTRDLAAGLGSLRGRLRIVAGGMAAANLDLRYQTMHDVALALTSNQTVMPPQPAAISARGWVWPVVSLSLLGLLAIFIGRGR